MDRRSFLMALVSAAAVPALPRIDGPSLSPSPLASGIFRDYLYSLHLELSPYEVRVLSMVVGSGFRARGIRVFTTGGAVQLNLCGPNAASLLIGSRYIADRDPVIIYPELLMEGTVRFEALELSGEQQNVSVVLSGVMPA